MAKILKEKEFNEVLFGQKLCRQFVTEYENEKSTKLPENENKTNYCNRFHTTNQHQKKRKLNLTLESIGVSPVNICGFAQHSCTCTKGKLKKA